MDDHLIDEDLDRLLGGSSTADPADVSIGHVELGSGCYAAPGDAIMRAVYEEV